MMSKSKFWTLYFLLNSLKFNSVEPISRVGNKIITFDSIMDALEEEADQAEEVRKHSAVIVGFGHMDNKTEDAVRNPNLSPLLVPSDKKIHHKTRPPVLGSLCDYEDYSKLFRHYYDIPFLKFAERLYEHKIIEEGLKQGDARASTERAWSICQFGGNMMECGENRKCRCLNRNPPYRYVKQKGSGESSLATCVGKGGSICSNDTRGPTNCEKGLNCIHGYCGGLKMAARTLSHFLGGASSVHGGIGVIIVTILEFYFVS